MHTVHDAPPPLARAAARQSRAAAPVTTRSGSASSTQLSRSNFTSGGASTQRARFSAIAAAVSSRGDVNWARSASDRGAGVSGGCPVVKRRTRTAMQEMSREFENVRQSASPHALVAPGHTTRGHAQKTEQRLAQTWAGTLSRHRSRIREFARVPKKKTRHAVAKRTVDVLGIRRAIVLGPGLTPRVSIALVAQHRVHGRGKDDATTICGCCGLEAIEYTLDVDWEKRGVKRGVRPGISREMHHSVDTLARS
eukprot:SAG11_NODE_42_length_20827_cov_9.289801_2_plen_252_part_00